MHSVYRVVQNVWNILPALITGLLFGTWSQALTSTALLAYDIVSWMYCRWQTMLWCITPDINSGGWIGNVISYKFALDHKLFEMAWWRDCFNTSLTSYNCLQPLIVCNTQSWTWVIPSIKNWMCSLGCVTLKNLRWSHQEEANYQECVLFREAAQHIFLWGFMVNVIHLRKHPFTASGT